MSVLRPLLLLTVALASIPACAHPTRPVSSAPSTRVHGRNDLITRAEMRKLGTAATVADVIQQLRPEFFRPAAIVGLAGLQRAFPAVYVNNRYVGGLEELEALSAETFIEARQLSAVEARGTFGALCRCEGGAIAVRVSTTVARRRS